MWFKKFTGDIQSIHERRTDEIDYWTVFKPNPYNKKETLVVRQGANSNLVGPDISVVLGSLEKHYPDIRWGRCPFCDVKGIGIVVYREFTKEYADRIKKKLEEIERDD